jgi:hypothetical protein
MPARLVGWFGADSRAAGNQFCNNKQAYHIVYSAKRRLDGAAKNQRDDRNRRPSPRLHWNQTCELEKLGHGSCGEREEGIPCGILLYLYAYNVDTGASLLEVDYAHTPP